jgi:hypothetical protein
MLTSYSNACRRNRKGCKRREAATSLCPGGARSAPYGYAPKGYEAQARKKYGPVKKKK